MSIAFLQKANDEMMPFAIIRNYKKKKLIIDDIADQFCLRDYPNLHSG